jgi:hypothetical protein
MVPAYRLFTLCVFLPKKAETATGVVAVSEGKETENVYWRVGVATMIEVCLERALQTIHLE